MRVTAARDRHQFTGAPARGDHPRQDDLAHPGDDQAGRYTVRSVARAMRLLDIVAQGPNNTLMYYDAFPGSGWSFLVSPAEGISTWTASFARGFGGTITGMVAIDVGVAAAYGFALSSPIAVVAMIRVWRRRPLVDPSLVLFATTIAAAVIAVATGLFGDPVAVSAVPPVLAAIVTMRVPDLRTWPGLVLPLLVIGWIGGVIEFAIFDSRIIAQLNAALAPAADPARTDALDLGGTIAARAGVMVDSVNAPAVVVGRGRARGLITPPDENFHLAILMSHVSAPFVAVPDPQSNVGARDQLNKAFPQLFQRGLPGYRLVYQNASWRLFGRE